MNKKGTSNPNEPRTQNYEAKKMNTSEKSKKKKDKDLPWWVELLFVQIGLPDKWLIKILKSKKISTDFIKNEKRVITTFIVVLAGITYFYPVVKYSKTKLDCESTAQNYIMENKNLVKINRKQLRMLATNFCNGGNEIYEYENIYD